MTEQRQYDGGAGTAHSSPVQQPGRSETPADPSSSAGPEAVAGPFTLRETVIGVSVLVMFTGTILPFVDGVNLWRAFPLFFLGIGILLPVAALALLIGRRSGARHLRVGSLSVDQFASVTAAFAAAFFFLQTVTTFGIGSFIALLGSVGFLVATVGGPHLGVFKSDFTGRPSSSAHPIAREALPARPRPPKADASEKAGGWKNFRPGSKAAPASDGPNSTGRSAGYAVAGYAAGQGAGNQQVPFSAGQGNAEDSAQAAPAAREPEPAATKATAVQPTPAQRSDVGRSDAQVSTAQSSSAQADAGRAEAAQPAATATQPKVEAAQPAAGEPENADAQSSHPRTESISATRDAEDEEPVLEAFWFAVGTPRSVGDEQTGAPLFVLQPGDWEVGIEDRGHEFLVQDKRTGRIGVMRDLRNIERAPREG